MKSIHEPIDVDLGEDGSPQSWRWRSRAWRVLRVLDRWVLQSRWWTGHGERRDYLLVEAAPDDAAHAPDACAVEIYWRRFGGDGPHDAWILARILS